MKKLLLSAILAAACVTTDVNAKDANAQNSFKIELGAHYQGPIGHVNTSVVGLADTLSKWAKHPDFKNNKKELNNAANALKKIAKFTESMVEVDSAKKVNKKLETASKAIDTFKSSMSNLKNSEFWKTCGGTVKDIVKDITLALQMLAQKDVTVNMHGGTFSSAEGLKEDGGASAQYNQSDSKKIITIPNGQTTISGLLTKFEEIYKDMSIDTTPAPTVANNTEAKETKSSAASKR